MSHPLTRPLSRAKRRQPLPVNNQPLIIAHRGASSEVAEHTLPAYVEAIDTGADGLECDVRLTRDGHLVCVHDRTVDRTSNGQGIVSELDLSGLQELDFQSWKREQRAAGRSGEAGAFNESHVAHATYLAGVDADRVHAEGGQVLTLDTLLGVVADVGRPLSVLIETKHPTRYGGLVEKELVRTLRRFGWGAAVEPGQPNVTIMSFAPTALRRVRLLAPKLPLVLLMDRSLPIRRDGALPLGVNIAGPSLRLLRSDAGYVARAHASGHRVYCWTIDKPADVKFAHGLGVDAIITNRPAAVRTQLSGF
jgi:glycerophosphoryl diester phosphodiesterase